MSDDLTRMFREIEAAVLAMAERLDLMHARVKALEARETEREAANREALELLYANH